ncbi:hypothetical protein DAPPUDRAFT_333545 [Daphnia pulex]|uniref:Uncharacterized protein n=1 Tax=Daphnia pulex TaxID=6669 RepID=E9HT48_DAPPU|nr:hypothetical protein DAPPUDRAFT_333545 [Daphnia pulex]|eukprot:EFX65083.1 hypothetical protein DAPPUDRAFT_333545 [Daphnia pulex]
MLCRLLFVIRNVIAKTIVLEKEAIRDLAANVKDIDDDDSAVGLPNKQLYWVLVDEHFFESKAEIPTEPKLVGLIHLTKKAFKSQNYT